MTETLDSRRRVGDGWRMMIILIAFYILNTADRSLLSLMVDPAKRDLHISDSQIGLLLGLAFALFYGAFGLPYGALVDRISRRSVLFFGVVTWSAATVASGLAQNYHELLAARIILGIGEAALMPAAHSLMADKFPPAKLGTALSIYYQGGVFGNTIAVVVGGAMIAHFSAVPEHDLFGIVTVRGWQMPLVIIGLLGIAISWLCFAFKEPPRTSAHLEEKSLVLPWKDIVAGRGSVLAAIAGSFVLYAMPLYATILWVPTFMTRTFGWTPDKIGFWYALVHLGGAGLGTLFGGMGVDALRKRGYRDAHLRVFLGCLLVAFPAGMLAFTAFDPYLFLLFATLLFFTGFGFSGYAAAMVQTIAHPSGRGRMAAIYLLLIIVVGNGLGPWLIGILTHKAFDGDVGKALLTMLAVVNPIAIASAYLGMKPMRNLVARLEAEQGTPEAIS